MFDLESQDQMLLGVNHVLCWCTTALNEEYFHRICLFSFFCYDLVTARYCNRLVNLGISKQQHLYLKTEFNLKTQT